MPLPLQLASRPVRRSLGCALLALAFMGMAGAAHAQRGGMGGPGSRGGMMDGPGERRGEGGGFGNEALRRAGPQLGPPGRWWDDKHMVKVLNLRTDQQRRMDDLFEASKASLVQLYSNLQHEEERLSTMSREDLQDETKVFAAIDRVALARADLAKANAHYSLQIRKELDPAQLDALDRQIVR